MFVLVLKVKVYGVVPPVAVTTTVPPLPLHGIGMVTEASAVMSEGCVTASVPVLVQPLASLTIQVYDVPAEMPEKEPSVLVFVLKVNVYGDVPPVAVTVTAPVPPIHGIAVVAEAPAVISEGCETASVPVLVQPLASLTLQL